MDEASNPASRYSRIWRVNKLACFGKNDYEEHPMNVSNGWHHTGIGIIWTGPGPWLFSGVAFYLEFTKKLSNRCIYPGLWLWWYGFSAHLLVCYAMCLWYSMFFGLFSFNMQDVYRKLFFFFISHTITWKISSNHVGIQLRGGVGVQTRAFMTWFKIKLCIQNSSN